MITWTKLHEQLTTINETKYGWSEDYPYVEVSLKLINSVHILLKGLERQNADLIPRNLHYENFSYGIQIDISKGPHNIFDDEYWQVEPKDIFQAEVILERSFDGIALGSAQWDLDGNIKVDWRHGKPKRDALWSFIGENSSPFVATEEFVNSLGVKVCEVAKVEGHYETRGLYPKGIYRGKIFMKDGSEFELNGTDDKYWVVYLAGGVEP